MELEVWREKNQDNSSLHTFSISTRHNCMSLKAYK